MSEGYVMLKCQVYVHLDDGCQKYNGMHNYNTVSEATADLNKRGYTIDFNLGSDGIRSLQPPVSLAADEFDITEVYRFEGNTDPDDEAVVYAIESHNGHKGVLVNGYGIYADSANDKMIENLAIRR